MGRTSGELARRVAAARADPGPFWAQPQTFRDRIRGGRHEPADRLRALRGGSRAA